MTWTIIGIFSAANFAAASSGGIFKPGDWYETLKKPSWVPPNWAFPVVWSVLFLMNAYAGALAWTEAGTQRPSLPFIVYGVSLLLNFAWSAIFFGMRRMDYAFAELCIFWLSLLAQIVLFASISPLASLLGVPYIVWVTIAGALNIKMLHLNDGKGAQTAT
ncbi:MAG: TspO/MBR family protein [Pseudomonadota bacterium]